MGTILNKHTADTPELKSKAEELAVKNANVILDVLRGMVEFDRYGQHFWIGENREAIEAWNKAFEILQQVKQQLVNLQKEEYDFMQTQVIASKVLAAKELGLMTPGTETSVESIFGQGFVYMQRMIQLLEHLCQMQYAGEQALAKGDLKIVYNAVSTTSRRLTKVALEMYDTLLEQSKFTHEVSDATSNILPDKVINVKPLLQEA
ncbi:hypothetical protein ACW2QC_10030 [Virgibacillus sp. FSP13]